MFLQVQSSDCLKRFVSFFKKNSTHTLLWDDFLFSVALDFVILYALISCWDLDPLVVLFQCCVKLKIIRCRICLELS